MVKCEKCGKNFRTLQALKDHFKAVHPNERLIVPKSTTSRNILVAVIIIILVIGSIVGYIIFFQTSHSQTTTSTETQSGILGTNIPSALYQNLSGVSANTLATVGSGQGVTGLTHISGSPLTDNGKPEVLYIGGEFCPYCAVQRWSMIIALAKFGTFTGLQYMQSSATDTPASISTFTFYNATFTSQYVSFVSVEEYDRARAPLQTPTAAQSAVFNAYDSGGTIPFLDIGNQYSITTSQALPGTIQNMNWTQIASQLDNPQSTVAKALDGAANTMITAICNIDGGNPSSVCGQSFAKLPILIPVGNIGLQLVPSVPTAEYSRLSQPPF